MQIRRTAGAKIANATFALDLQRHVSTCKLEGKCGRANSMLIYFFFSSSKRKQGKDCGGQVSVKRG